MATSEQRRQATQIRSQAEAPDNRQRVEQQMFVCNCSSDHVQLTGNCNADAMPTGLHADELHMFHRAGGCLTAAVVIALAGAILHRETAKLALRVLVTLGALAVIAQVALGIATIFTSRELVTMTLHSSLGAALLACLVAGYWIACPSAAPALRVRTNPEIRICAAVR